MKLEFTREIKGVLYGIVIRIRIIVALSGANEYKLHLTMKLMSHITVLIIWITVNRKRSRMTLEIGHERCAFIKDARRKAIYMNIMISEKQIQMQKNVWPCFV